MRKYAFLVDVTNVKPGLVSLVAHDAMCGTQADLRAIVMDRATAGLLLMLDRPADPLQREGERDSVYVCKCSSKCE